MFDLSAKTRLKRSINRNISALGGPTPLSIGLYSVLRRDPFLPRAGVLPRLWRRLLRFFGLGRSRNIL